MLGLMSLCSPGLAQKQVSMELGAIRNTQTPINGINLGCFYHFNRSFTAGLEVNRFFSVPHRSEAADIRISALDIELNMHYLVQLYKGFHVYPVAGVGYDTENEKGLPPGDTHTKIFWSLNTGSGLLWEVRRWSPHIEYIYAWGQEHHQFLLAGISYEISLLKAGHSR